jgi:PIN domain nuclease of toxin-antitoxin system
MMVLDTHAWIWIATESPEIPETLRRKLKNEEMGVSVISCWEVAMLVSKKRLSFTSDIQDWIEAALQLPRIRLLPLDPKIMVLATRLPGYFHEDPVDRMIVATCLHHQATLVTRDQRITGWGFIRTLW